VERPAPPRAPVPSPAPALGRAPTRGSPGPALCGATRYAPRRPQASPLYRLLADHFETLTRVHEERYEPTHGPLRAVVAEVVGRFLDCGLLEHGFARVRCAACRAEFLVASRCKGRGFCPSCQARRLAEWSLWLDEALLAAGPHRHVVLTIPKRLRAYFLYDRRRFGLLSQVAYRTLRAYLVAALGEPDAVPGVVSLSQSFGALAHWHPHLHLVVSDGVFQRDGAFVGSRAHDPAVLAEAWRRAVLAMFVKEGWLEADAAASMLAWPHSGFSAYMGPAIAADDRAAVLRVARYGARAPVAESRLRYDAERAEVELASDAREGPYAGVHRFTAVEFVARLVDHIPGKGEVRVRYYGAYASRRRGWWRRRGVVLVGAEPEDEPSAEREGEPEPWPALKARRRRWAELLRMIFKVDVEVCPACGGEMRILAFVTEPAVVRRILAHLESRGVDARAGPWAGAGLAAG
jgi:hypothetical protein